MKTVILNSSLKMIAKEQFRLAEKLRKRADLPGLANTRTSLELLELAEFHEEIAVSAKSRMKPAKATNGGRTRERFVSGKQGPRNHLAN